MRNTFADTIYQVGRKNSKLAIVVADISPAGSIAKFREDFPERFINTGIAEQVMIGLCAGMVQRGMRTFAYTIAPFALYRPFEFIRNDLAYQYLPVTVVGIGAGITYSTLGATHHAMEDIAVASAIPGMSILAPCDPVEVGLITTWCAEGNNGGPVYLRLAKAGEPILTATADPFVINKIRYIQKGYDYCILSYGHTVKKALELAKCIESKKGKSVSVISCHMIKPLDVEGIKQAICSHDNFIVLEEHVSGGGMGLQIKSIAWDIKATCNLKTFALQDKFIHKYGSHEELLDCHGLSMSKIFSQLGY